MLFRCALFSLFVVSPVLAQDCVDLVVPYSDEREDSDWHLRLDPAGNGALFYFGARHSDDPSDPQFELIEKAYADFGPTVVFYEGPARPIAETRDETIRLYGESGYIRYLGTRDSLRIARLEPDPGQEMQYILRSFSAEQAMLFFILREASRLRERKGMSREEIEKTIASLLERAASMMPVPFKTVDELAASYSKYWSDPAEWWQAPQKWFDPEATSEETGGIFTNDVNKASSHFRNRHMYAVLSEAAQQGERVFAVVGRNHVPMQAEALKCALAKR